MSPRTKKKIKYARWIQLALRILELLGTLGLLVCVICLKGMQSTVGWVTRIVVRRYQEANLHTRLLTKCLDSRELQFYIWFTPYTTSLEGRQDGLQPVQLRI